MAISELYAVTETVSTTEWSFTTDTAGPDADTTDGEVQGFFDVSALAAGDEFQFKVYEKVNSGGTQRIIYQAMLVGAQSEPIFVTPKLLLMHGWDMTWDKIAGTDRSIVGSIRSYNADDIAAVKADTAAILLDTAEIGAAGAGLTALATAANLATVAGYLDTEIAAILADTNELQTDWANGGRLDLILDARASQTSVDTVDDLLDTEVAAIKTVVDAVKVKTDKLTFTAANKIDANILNVNSQGIGATKPYDTAT